MQERNKGITLIALVITIIILIILSGVAINLSLGENGIFGKAKKATKQYEISSIQEKIQMSITELEIEKAANNEMPPTLEEDILPKLYEEKTIIADNGVEKSENKAEKVEVITPKGYIIEIIKNENGKYEINYIKETDINIQKAPEPTIELEIENEALEQVQVVIKVTAKEEKYGIRKIQLIDGNTGKITTTLTYEEGTKIVEDLKFTVSENGEYEIRVISNAPKQSSKKIEVKNILEILTIMPSETEWTNENITLEVLWPATINEETKQISLEGSEDEKYISYTGNEQIEKNQVVYVRCKKENSEKYITGNINIENIDKLPPKEYNQTAKAEIGQIRIEANTQDEEATEEYGKSEINQYMYQIDGKEWVSVGLQTNYTVKVESGEHTVTTKAIDQAGNEKIATNKEEKVIVKDLEEYENEIEIVLKPEEIQYAKEKTLEVNWPSDLNSITGITKQISIDGGSNFSPYTGSIIITENCIVYAQIVYGEETITAVLNIESIDKEGPTITATFDEEEMKLTAKVKDEKAGLASIKIEKITSATQTGEKVYTQIGETYTYEGTIEEQQIEENIRAAYMQYLRGYKITAIDECENEYIVEVTNLSILNTETIIYTAQELKNFADSVNSGNTYEGLTVQLGADIDLSELTGSWVSIGCIDSEAITRKFQGEFNGNGHKISNMKITKVNSSEDTVYAGLFGYVGAGAKISNVILENYEIKLSSQMTFVGGLVAYNTGGTISNISATGKITMSSYTEAVGGLVGCHHGTIEKAYTGGEIKIKTPANTAEIYVGGICGSTFSSATEKDTYSTVNISGSYINYAGGIVGYTKGSNTVTNCYYLGELTAYEKYGGIAGLGGGTVTNSYYCSDIITEPTNSKGTGLTEANMKLKSSYSGWDISESETENTIWLIRDGECPILRWMK